MNAFGSSNNNNNNTGSGLFGANNNNNTNNSPFGASNNNNTSAFGASNGGMFGGSNNNQQQQQPGGGLFGAKPATGGLFGSNNATTGGGLFGANNNQQQQQQGGGLFGAKPATGGVFGSNNATTGATGGGLFGANNNNNQQQQGGGLFGANNNNNQQQPQQSGGLFGAKPATGGLFGGNNAGATGSTGGLFGGNNNAGTTGSTGGLFGGGNNNNAAPGTTGGLFGGNNNAATGSTGASGGLFGAKPAASGGLFGNTSNTASTNAFGSNTGTSGGLFGAKPAATGGLFGSNSNTSGGLFGGNNNTNNTQTSNNGGGLFGGSSTLGNNNTLNNNTSNNTNAFGTSNNNGMNQLGQSNPIANISAQNPYGNNPLFSSISGQQAPQQQSQTGALATPIGGSTKENKKTVSLSSAYRITKIFNPTAVSNNSMMPEGTTQITPSQFTKPNSVNTSSSSVGPFSDATDNAIISSDIFAPKVDFKKLVLNKQKLSEGSRLIDSAEQTGTKKVSFVLDNQKPSLEENKSELTEKKDTIKTTFSANGTATSTSAVGGRLYDEDGYWTSPSLHTLKQMTPSELRSIKDFKVGRRHYGEISFTNPVDLSSFVNLDDIAGNLVTFLSKSCLVYPDETLKPQKGEGLNIPARVTLESCYPVNKKDKLPILDPKSEYVKLHIDKLKKIPDMKFNLYDPATGSWTFSVESMS